MVQFYNLQLHIVHHCKGRQYLFYLLQTCRCSNIADGLGLENCVNSFRPVYVVLPVMISLTVCISLCEVLKYRICSTLTTEGIRFVLH